MPLVDVSEAQAKSYYLKVLPYAQQVQAKTNIPAPLVVAFWSWETHFGTNESSIKGNNHAGIKSNSKGAQFTVGIYAGYKSIADFAADYARTLMWDAEWTGYPEVIRTAKRTNDYATITRAMNASKWAEDDYNVTTIVARAKGVEAASKGYTPPVTVPGQTVDADTQQMAQIGAAFVAAIALAIAATGKK